MEELAVGPEFDDWVAVAPLLAQEGHQFGDLARLAAGGQAWLGGLVAQRLGHELGDAALLAAHVGPGELVAFPEQQAEVAELVESRRQDAPHRHGEVTGHDPEPRRITLDLGGEPLGDAGRGVVRVRQAQDVRGGGQRTTHSSSV